MLALRERLQYRTVQLLKSIRFTPVQVFKFSFVIIFIAMTCGLYLIPLLLEDFG